MWSKTVHFWNIFGNLCGLLFKVTGWIRVVLPPQITFPPVAV